MTMRSMQTILLPVLLATALTAAETRVRVSADHTSLRYQNADTVEVACLVSTGQELTVRGTLEGSWVPVVPPDDVSVWIYAELVRKGEVIRDKAQLRSGPGLNYKVVGSLDHGIPVEVRSRLGDWLKIRPLSGFTLWIRRSAIVEIPATTPTTLLPMPPELASGILSALTENTNATAPVIQAETNSVTSPPQSAHLQ